MIFQTELLRGRQLFLHTICNSTVKRSSREFVVQVKDKSSKTEESFNSTSKYENKVFSLPTLIIQFDAALTEYEGVCRKAADQGVDLVTKVFFTLCIICNTLQSVLHVYYVYCILCIM